MKKNGIERALREPSTWAGIGGPLGVLGTQIPPPWSFVCFVLAAMCGVAAVVLREASGASFPTQNEEEGSPK